MLQLKSAWEPLLLLPRPPPLLHHILLFSPSPCRSSSSTSPLSSLSLLRPRTALHDGGAKNSIRNPRINSKRGGWGEKRGGGRQHTQGHNTPHASPLLDGSSPFRDLSQLPQHFSSSGPETILFLSGIDQPVNHIKRRLLGFVS